MLFALFTLAIAPIAPVEEIAETVEEILVVGQQDLLQELGWYEGEVDGIWGPLTESAVEDFVDAAELDVVNPVTVLFAAHEDDAPEAPEPETTAASVSPSSSIERSGGGEAPFAAHWLALADCESGEWDANGDPLPGSRRWDYGAPGAFSRAGFDFDGGLNFASSTWDWVAGDLGLLSQYPRAFLAPPEVQVRVGQEVQRRQGWRAWPVCSRKIGLR